MRLEVTYLNNEAKQETDKDVCSATWHSKRKVYESQQMDEDMKVCTISHKVDRVILNDVQITGKYQVNDLIEFLQNLKPSLMY
jgi:hypothetical protein